MDYNNDVEQLLLCGDNFEGKLATKAGFLLEGFEWTLE